MTAVTWNPSDAQTGATFTNGNLDASGAASNFTAIRATQGYSSGAYYFEVVAVTYDTGGFSLEGIADNTTTLTGTAGWYPGNVNLPNSIGCQIGTNYASGTFTADVAAPLTFGANNDVMMFAVDVTNKKVWNGKNGTWLGGNTPVVGAATQWGHWTGALTVFPCISVSNIGTTRLHATAASFAFSAPSGFSPWDASATGVFRRSLSSVGTRTGSRQGLT